MIVIFKLDREGRGIGTRYRYEVRVTIYADQPMDLIKRRKDERIEELSARELWR